MTKVLVFSGTSEGKAISRWLKDNGIDVCVSVATEYGGRDSDSDLNTHTGSYGGSEGIAKAIGEEGYDLVIDATHPYATSISAHVREGCEIAGVEHMRVSREGSDLSGFGNIIHADDTDHAVRIIAESAGKVLVTTGMKELEKFTKIPNYRDRIVARVLSVKDSVLKAMDLGFDGESLVCARGPFSEEFNHALIRQTGATMLVTKDTGSEGGLDDKLRAARKAGIKVILIRRPDNDGISVEEALKVLANRFGIAHEVREVRRMPSLAIIGIGMGNGTLTQDAAERIASADVLFGAERMLASVDVGGKHTVTEYRSDIVLDYLDEHPEYVRPAVLVSGDVGFYSGAKKLLESIDRERYRVEVYCGISSMVYLASRIGLPWQDLHLMSAHGKEANIIGTVRVKRGVFTLLTGSNGAPRLCDELVRFGLDDVNVIIGQDLGSDRERIHRGRPSELRNVQFSELCAAIVLNDSPDPTNPIGMDDDEFVRGPAPMTKSEVRSISVVKLKLRSDSIIYDIGAGTGSVSVEMARVANEGHVYAFEKEIQATDLIECNKRKFATPNITVISGLAPASFAGLPVPTHAFIGGSSGNLKEIVSRLLEMNPDIRIVINAVTLETIGEVTEVIREFGFSESEILSISISKARELGRYHLMTAQNPIYVVTVQR